MRPQSSTADNSILQSATILLVEDDDDLAELMQIHLKFQGHQVIRVEHKETAEARYQSEHHIDMLILDRGLPDGDGLDLCRHLRAKGDWVPILVLTARDGEMDKVDGLEAGVDDYITKPFSVLEFQARVRNTLRRQAQHHVVIDEPFCREAPPEPRETDVLQLGALTILPSSHRVQLADNDITLTATEFSLLHFLASRPGRVFSKDDLLEHVWHTQHSGYHHTVCSTINRLRTKLQTASLSHDFIRTVWGVGYKFQPQD